jgi:hypothetical protein
MASKALLKGNIMGFFSEDKPVPPQPQPANNKGFWHEAGIFIIGAVIGLIAWTVKLFLSFLSKHTPDKVKIFLLVILPILVYSLVPQIRDTLTLSRNTTVNVVDELVVFPSREQFYRRDGGKFEQDGKKFITYRKKYISMVWKDECYLVPRGELLSLKINRKPVFVVGFEEEPIYGAFLKNKELPTKTYISRYITSPSNLYFLVSFQKNVFDEREELQFFKTSWKTIAENGDNGLLILITSKWNENAMICF